jgi:hypothetical protein
MFNFRNLISEELLQIGCPFAHSWGQQCVEDIQYPGAETSEGSFFNVHRLIAGGLWQPLKKQVINFAFPECYKYARRNFSEACRWRSHTKLPEGCQSHLANLQFGCPTIHRTRGNHFAISLMNFNVVKIYSPKADHSFKKLSEFLLRTMCHSSRLLEAISILPDSPFKLRSLKIFVSISKDSKELFAGAVLQKHAREWRRRLPFESSPNLRSEIEMRNVVFIESC